MSFFSSLFTRFRRFPEREQLVVDVANELKRRGITGGIYNHQEYTITVGNKAIGLHNLFLDWRLYGPREKPKVIKRWLDGTLDGPDGRPLGTYAEVAETLLPLVRSRHYICVNLLNNQIAGAPPGNPSETAWVPFVGDLVTAVGIDSQNGIASVMPGRPPRSRLKRGRRPASAGAWSRRSTTCRR